MNKTAVSFSIQLTPDTRAEVIMRVIEEPAAPTPSEPDKIRGPLVTEWTEILKRLLKLDRVETKRACWPSDLSPASAEAIATDILTPAFGPECHRIQLMEKNPDGSERNHGGYIKSALIDTIRRHLP